MTGGPYCYTYDGNGVRVMKANVSGSSCPATSQSQVDVLYWRALTGDTIAETDGSGSTTNSNYHEYIFFGGRRIARSDPASGNVYFYFVDQLGSTRSVAHWNASSPSTDGAVCFSVDYYPYGQELDYATNCPQNYKFTGYELDSETGNFYAFARHYSPRLGRFLSPDPLGGSPGNPQGMNRYAYVLNMPLMATDPSGRLCIPVASNLSDDGESKGAGHFPPDLNSEMEPEPQQGDCANDPGGVYFNGEWMPSAGLVGCLYSNVIYTNSNCQGIWGDVTGNVFLTQRLSVPTFVCTSTSPNSCSPQMSADWLIYNANDSDAFSAWQLAALGGVYGRTMDGFRLSAEVLAAGGVLATGGAVVAGGSLMEAGSLTLLGANALIYGENALQGDAFHAFPAALDSIIMEVGELSSGASGYIQYNMSGSVIYNNNLYDGVFQIGGYQLETGTFYVTHHVFIPNP